MCPRKHTHISYTMWHCSWQQTLQHSPCLWHFRARHIVATSGLFPFLFFNRLPGIKTQIQMFEYYQIRFDTAPFISLLRTDSVRCVTTSARRMPIQARRKQIALRLIENRKIISTFIAQTTSTLHCLDNNHEPSSHKSYVHISCCTSWAKYQPSIQLGQF